MEHATGTPGELDGLRTRYGQGWLIGWHQFPDGWRFDARPLGEGRPRLVTETAAELDEAIAAVEAGTWRPAR